jgi:hypothetical protein
MNLRIDGRPTALAAVVVYEEKFGARYDFQVVSYELEIEKADFVARLEPVYDEYVEELKRDEAIVGRFQPPFTGAVDYPSFEALLDLEPKPLREFIETFLAYDIVPFERSIGR